MLVASSMFGLCKLGTMSSLSSVGMAMLSFLMLLWVHWVSMLTIEVGMTLYVHIMYGSNGI